MCTAIFFIFGELNDFLLPAQKYTGIEITFNYGQSIKHLIESLHIPHTEVGKMVSGTSEVDFSYIVQDGDNIFVHPHSVDAKNSMWVDGKPKFILDNHLGRLASYLRMMGFDTLYRNDYQDNELSEIAVHEQRVLLTRDRGLLMRKVITSGYCIRERNPRLQAIEVVKRFSLSGMIKPFQRCLRCNQALTQISKEHAIERLQPLTRKYFDEFHICVHCDKIYWKGSHYEKMMQHLNELKNL